MALSLRFPRSSLLGAADSANTQSRAETSSNSAITAKWNFEIDLFDPRKVDAGPFSTWMLPSSGDDTVAAVSTNMYSHKQWVAGEGRVASFEFSKDGRALLISAAHSSSVFVVDAFNGDRLLHWYGRKNLLGDEIEAHFSPDGSLVSTGSSNGDILVFHTHSGLPAAHLAPSANGPVLNARFHPSLDYLISTDVHMSLFSKPSSS